MSTTFSVVRSNKGVPTRGFFATGTSFTLSYSISSKEKFARYPVHIHILRTITTEMFFVHVSTDKFAPYRHNSYFLLCTELQKQIPHLLHFFQFDRHSFTNCNITEIDTKIDIRKLIVSSGLETSQQSVFEILWEGRQTNCNAYIHTQRWSLSLR